jgi:ribosomal protein S12 methylthiotransferase accessory factor
MKKPVLTLKTASKGYTLDTHRVKTPEATLQDVKGLVGCAGITRVAEITGLDRLGIPVFTAMRPRAASGAVTVYNGKGFTPQEAEVSAIMEAVERFSAEYNGSDLVACSFWRLKDSFKVLDPSMLIVPWQRHYSEGDELEWAKGVSLTRGGEVLVPAEAVFHPYARANQLFRTNTNGLAAGNVMEEAVLHALMELVERDAWSLFEVDPARSRDLELAGCSCEPLKKALQMLDAASIKISLKDISSDVGITTIAAALDDEVTKDPALLSLGVGTHLMPEIAALRALTEAVQSRLTTIHGTREDTFMAEYARRIGYERMKRLNKKWFLPSQKKVKIEELSRFSSGDFLEDIRYTLGRLKNAGLDEVIAVDLTRKELGIPAVRVIVPGLEVYAMDRERIGLRLKSAMKKTI